LTKFLQNTQILKMHEKPPSGSPVVPRRCMDRHTQWG